jgi:toxin ParE1/3/4
MKPWRVRLSQSAEADFSQIVAWTATHFGDVQAQKYAEVLTLAITALHEGPDVIGAKTRDDIGHELKSLHVARMGRKGSHFVVFRAATKNTIDVLRVLHESMDLARHLPPEDLQH